MTNRLEISFDTLQKELRERLSLMQGNVNILV